MTQDEDSNDDRKPIPGSIPSSVRKAGAEARIAEKKASDEWIHVDELAAAINDWTYDRKEIGEWDAYEEGHFMGRLECAVEIEELIKKDDHESG